MRQLTLDPVELFAPLLTGAGRVLVAVSGGPDSMALLYLLAQWAAHPPLIVATVDHGLRAESASEARVVARAASGLSLPHHTLIWEGTKPATGLGAAARNARYGLLEALAARENCTHLVTAHHSDDQAETVLMRLIAGSGPAGLAAMRMRAQRGALIQLRPFLNLPKAALTAYCAAHDIPFVTDPSNADPRFGRGRLRQSMAAVHGLGMTNARLTKLAARMADMNDAIEAAALAAIASAEKTSLQWSALAVQPVAIRRRVLGMLIERVAAAPALELEKLERLEGELHAAFQAGLPLRRTLAERAINLSKQGALTVTMAPPRRAAATR